MKLYVTTLNCGKNNLGNGNTDTIELLLSNDDKTGIPYDFYVFGFQEYVSLSDLGDSSVFEKNILGFSNDILNYLHKTTGVQYSIVKYNYCGGLCILVVGKESALDDLDCIILNSRCGMLWSGLKGGSLIRVYNKREKWVINFVSSHLAANEGLYNQRVENIKYILNDFDKQLSENLVKSNISDEQLVFFGDLNFRNNSIEGLDINEPNCYLNQAGFERDELHRYLNNRDCNLFNFKEFHIKFKPTYKYKEEGDPSKETQSGNMYNFKRVPSWCDRILLSTSMYEHSGNYVYKSVPRESKFLKNTDHQAVTLSLEYDTMENTRPIVSKGVSLNPEDSVADFAIRKGCKSVEHKSLVLFSLLIILLFIYII